MNNWQSIREKPLVILSAIFLLIVTGAILSSLIFNYNNAGSIDFSKSTNPPSWAHPFGTNTLGQDLLSRVILGGRISLAVGLMSMLVAILLGTSIGAVAGFYGGIVDQILMRFLDVFLALPQLPLLLLLIYLFKDAARTLAGPNLGIFALIVLVIGGLNWMSLARLVRANFLKLKAMDYVMAARASGASDARIILVHLLANTWHIIALSATITIGNAIITESTLSFLGLGFPPDIPPWGRLLFDAKDYLGSAPYLAIFPGLIIFLTVLSINNLAEITKNDKQY